MIHEFIANKYPEEISWLSFSKNPNFDIPTIQKYYQGDLYYIATSLAQNPSISLNDLVILGNDDIFLFIHSHPELTWDFVKKYLHKSWHWKELAKRDFIRWEHILESPKLLEVCSINPNITPKIVYENDWIMWSYVDLSRNPNLTMEFILQYIDEMDWYQVSINSSITWENVINFPELPWRWDGLSQNPNITWEIIKNNLDKPWHWLTIGMNKNITPQIIDENIHFDWYWNWHAISYNPNLTATFIKKHRDKDWNERVVFKYLNWRDICELGWNHSPYILEYPYLNLEILQKYEITTDRINWYISQNKLLKTPFVQNRIKKIWSCYKKYKMRQLLKVIACKYRVNGEIKYMPNRGVEFFKIMEELQDMKFS